MITKDSRMFFYDQNYYKDTLWGSDGVIEKLKLTFLASTKVKDIVPVISFIVVADSISSLGSL